MWAEFGWPWVRLPRLWGLSLLFSAVFAPLLPPFSTSGTHDYIYNLDESEGVCDLFDVPSSQPLTDRSMPFVAGTQTV